MKAQDKTTRINARSVPEDRTVADFSSVNRKLGTNDKKRSFKITNVLFNRKIIVFAPFNAKSGG